MTTFTPATPPPPAAGLLTELASTAGAASDGRVFYRHPTEKRLGGVCGGMADYFDNDPTLVRLLWAATAVITLGGSLIVYGLLWLLLPVGSQATGRQRQAWLDFSASGRRWLAYGLVGLGLLWLLANIGLLAPLWAGLWTLIRILFWPAVLVAVGLAILRHNRSQRSLAADLQARLPDAETVKQTLKGGRQRLPLKRSRENRILLGVCGGLARTLKLDVTVVRLLWALFALGSLGTGVIVYVIAALVMPEDAAAIAITEAETEATLRTVV
jgi:phage shock protein PspC (stress-responsive transcriptional regulator)